ncbi:MAG: nucleotidyltransferase family protein [Chloroflexota bacterium]|nr:nucleotidyltransferase family protein [Candidatus Sulfotelmatobacter sp.]
MEIESEKLPRTLWRKGLPEKLTEICRKNDVIFMALFGSYVRKEQHKKSDVDIVIKFDPTKRKTLLDLIGLQDELSKAFRKKVDLGTLNSISPYITDNVKKEMCIIYGEG